MSIPSVRSFHVVALGVIAGCALSLPVMAGDGPECQRHKAARMEAEGFGDGQISATEHAATAQKRFETMDVNKDGRVTADEINASHGAESIAWAKHPISAADKIKKLDTNNDGALTAREYADGSQKMFDKLDVDGDGYLTADEMRVETKSNVSAHNAN
jgi:Ca2+-binding EF-hand superfamily protein